MAKKIGLEVVSTKPVCVDFLDGRTVSFRPGQRFEAEVTNSSVMRLLRTREVRKLSAFEAIPSMPVKLGAPKRVQNVLKARAKVESAKRAAAAKLATSKAAPPSIEEIDLSTNKKTSKKSTKTSSDE